MKFLLHLLFNISDYSILHSRRVNYCNKCQQSGNYNNKNLFYYYRRSAMSDTCYKKNSDKSNNPNAWVINNDKDIRLEDMRKTFQALGVLQPAKSGKKY